MQSSEYINLIEPTPKLHTKKCRFIAKSIEYTLRSSVALISVTAWYMYDYFVAGATLILSFIIVGIIRAKLRNAAIPLTQQEYHYTDKGIAVWYSAKFLCSGDKYEKQ